MIFPLNSDKSPATGGRDWKEYRGDVNTPMIGVPIPAGAVVFDLDTYKGITTDDVDSALGCFLDWDIALLQRTPKGGEHYAFSVPVASSIINGVNVLGVKGFDIRSSGKGYIATGEGYVDESLFGVIDTLHEVDMLPVLPGDVLTLLSAQVDTSNADNDLMLAITSQPLDINNDDMLVYLSKLNCDHAADHDTWLKVMMGIYHQTSGSEEGYLMFDDFSKLSPDNYNKVKNKKRWESLSKSTRTNPITFASVIEIAGGHDAIAKEKYQQNTIVLESAETVEDLNNLLANVANSKIDTLALEILLKKVNAKYKVISGDAPGLPALKKLLKSKRDNKKTGNFVDDYVFMTHSAEYIHVETKAVMGPRSFDVKHNRETPANGEGEKQSATIYSNDIIICVENSMYVPKFGEIFNHNGLDYINLYAKPDLKLVDVGTTNIVDRIKSHIAHMLPDKTEQEIIINYLAHNVQLPGEKIQWSIVLQGVQGDGKSLLAEMMQHVMGFANVRLMNVQTLESTFTGWSVGQCMTFIEEIKLDNYRKYEILNNLKPYITNDIIECTKKGKDPQVVVNTTNYFALTNFKDALPIDDNDRRWCILFSQWQSGDKLKAWMADGNQNYYSNLYNDMRENIGEIAQWLHSHKIPGAFKSMKIAPETSAKNQMRDLTKSDAMLLVEDAINQFWCEDINDDVVNITKLSKEVASVFQDGYEHWPKNAAIKNVLIDMAYHNIGRYKDDNRKNQTIYCKDDKRVAIEFKNINVPF